MTEKDDLMKLCDEISQLIPSYNIKDTATSQFKEFIELLKKKVSAEEIKAIVQSYNYFNKLMSEINPDTSARTKDEDKESQLTKEPLAPAVLAPAVLAPAVLAPAVLAPAVLDPSAVVLTPSNDTSESEEIIELLLHLSEKTTRSLNTTIN
jgi:acyl-CoA reductase-like NAD-dependent aldehyde dehydrogenase